MTNITGKIYQMKNADGTENRFPRTVIEAVLGLSSYLQDQFSSLADIYMPIEGIYEALTGQEFVYRKSPNTIKAKSLTLDRIKGKSLAWNQLVQNSSISGTNSNAYPYAQVCQITVPAIVHKYLFKVTTTSTGVTGVYAVMSNSSGAYVEPTLTGSNGYYSMIFSGYGYNGSIYLRIRKSSEVPVTWKNAQIYDLTLMGLDSITTVAEFDALYPSGNYSYNAGTLISNDTSEIETVGRNVWDEEWEVGGISQENGMNTESQKLFRSKNYIPCFPGSAYYFHSGTDDIFGLRFYDAAKNFIGYNAVVSPRTFTLPANTRFLRFVNVARNTYNHDICINLSDTSFNGQYEPYRKSTLPLNLNDFWVKDGQGNQVHITGGLKSAGSVYDEIVGNKYIQRVGRVNLGDLSWTKTTSGSYSKFYSNGLVSAIKAPSRSEEKGNIVCAKYSVDDFNIVYYGRSNKVIGVTDATSVAHGNLNVIDSAYDNVDASSFKAAMSGVMLYYELATPIEYELVEPLIYTMRAGTTEARISPNEDGLSAPFCCDMTYSANENNDAGNAQYAATAGRLLNSHKIWGQDFNGTGDITGELTGVTNLTASGIITGSRLVSTVGTGTAPLTVASTTMVQNLVAEKASKLLTARTIWGQSFDGSGNISGAISNITTISASGLATIAGGIALGISTKAQAAKMIWDEINNAWHLQGNLYADGSISAKGAINNNTDYVTQQQYNELISRIEALEG